MFYRTTFKWLTITLIVLGGFLIILLFLGYLLKENEEITGKLKAKLEQEAQQAKAKEEAKNIALQVKELTPTEKSQLQIIKTNQSCETDKQCFMIHTDNPNIGCLVTINARGAAILLKVAGQESHAITDKTKCQQHYQQTVQRTVQCVDNLCRSLSK